VFTGDALPEGESALLISNHRTRLDWMVGARTMFPDRTR
jgi:1-acyl-sn-glycerol-3-phosphate acyltransferase